MNPKSPKNGLCQLLAGLSDEKTRALKKLLQYLADANCEIQLEELVERLKFLEKIIDSLPDATLAVDSEGKVIVWNKAMEEITGVGKELIIGRREYANVLPFYGEKSSLLVDIILGSCKEWEKYHKKIERNSNALVSENFVPLASRDKGLNFLALATPIFDESGNLLGVVQFIRDVSELKKLEEKLKCYNNHDTLTGLYNRTFFKEELQRLEKSESFPIT